MRARPLEQVLDEVEEGRVGPLEVLEDEDDRASLGEPLEEEPPRGEEVLAVARRASRAEQCAQPRLEPGALVRVGTLLEHRAAASASASSGVSSSAISARMRTISASAQ
jgi:hypothetical protein